MQDERRTASTESKGDALEIRVVSFSSKKTKKTRAVLSYVRGRLCGEVEGCGEVAVDRCVIEFVTGTA